MRKEQITVNNNSVCNSTENKGLEGKGMKRRLLHFKKRMVPAVSGALMGVMLRTNVMEFAQAYQQQDSSTMNSALKGIVAGVMMAGISTVLTFLGF